MTMKKKHTGQAHVRLPESLEKKIRDRAARIGKTPSAIIRSALANAAKRWRKAKATPEAEPDFG